LFRAIVGFFRKNDEGQDLSEYCLIAAFVALIAFGIFWHISGGMQGMWNHANSTLAASNSATASTDGGSQH
jgi:Flp pilus assembly pilin Flp